MISFPATTAGEHGSARSRCGRTAVVIGAGVAGLATALALRNDGWQVSVRERAPGPARAGMGFLLMENGMAALTRLGLDHEASLRGVIADGSVTLRPDGSVFQERRFAPHVGLTRAALIELLGARLPDGIVEYGREAAVVETEGGPAGLAGATDAGADLVVGADGQRSAVRGYVAPGHRACRGRVAELISEVTAPGIVARLGSRLVRVRHPDGGLGAGVVPTSRDSLVWYLTHDTRRWPHDGGQESLRRLAGTVADWPWPFPDLLSRTDVATSYVWRTADMDAVPCLFRENVVLVGDAAHPFLPFSTQGVNSALVDAVTLADALAGEGPLATALVSWSARRSEVLPAYLEYGRARAAAFLDPVPSPGDPPFPEAAGQLDLQNLTHPEERR